MLKFIEVMFNDRCYSLHLVTMVVVVFEWTWDEAHKSAAAELSQDEREVRFHINYSSGTAAVCGTQVMADRQYFWEVKMTTPVYGTDMVIVVSELICLNYKVY